MTRRDFIKLAGVSAAILAAPASCRKKAAVSGLQLLPARISVVRPALQDAGARGSGLDSRRPNVFLI